MATNIKLPGGLKVNVGKKGVGASISKKGFGVGIGPNGGRVRASIPGTGISWSESVPKSKLKKLIDAFINPKKNKKENPIDENIEVQAELVCSMCGEKVYNFRDDKSKKEFKETGLCQKCQDEMRG